MGLSRFGDRIEAAAAQNPDGSVCAAAMNPAAETLCFSLRLKDRGWPVVLEGDSISTFVFSPDETVKSEKQPGLGGVAVQLSRRLLI